MPMRHAPDIRPSEITPKAVWLRRRELLAGAAALGLAGSIAEPAAAAALAAVKSPLSTDQPPTPLEDITTYNNYYEFGPQGRPRPQRRQAHHAPLDGQDRRHGRQPRRLSARGHPQAGDPGGADLSPALRRGLVDGDPLGRLPVGRSAQAGGAFGQCQYVAFETLVRPEEMPGQRGCSSPNWPYVEGLRLDEAMHPLTIMAVGLYGETLPNQDGAPIAWSCRGSTASRASSRWCA